MTRLPPPEQWVLSKMSEMEVAEMIEEHIDYYTVDEDGTRRSVHLPTPFVRHFMKRSDRVLPTVVAIRSRDVRMEADGPESYIFGPTSTRRLSLNRASSSCRPRSQTPSPDPSGRPFPSTCG